jgi:hypothetical protein
VTAADLHSIERRATLIARIQYGYYLDDMTTAYAPGVGGWPEQRMRALIHRNRASDAAYILTGSYPRRFRWQAVAA